VRSHDFISCNACGLRVGYSNHDRAREPVDWSQPIVCSIGEQSIIL